MDVKQKRKQDYLARKKRLEAYKASINKKHILCVDGDPNLPITCDAPPGSKILYQK